MIQVKKILSSEDCYEGYDKKNEEWLGGSYGFLLEEGCEEIEFSQDQWEQDYEYFKEFLDDAIKKFQKRFKTEVLEVVLCGKVGLWNGSPIGGAVVKDSLVFNFGDSVDSIDVVVEEDCSINIQGHHHDGTHSMGIYFVTNSVLKDTGYKGAYERDGASALDADFFEKLYEKRKPLKLEKNNSYFRLAV